MTLRSRLWVLAGTVVGVLAGRSIASSLSRGGLDGTLGAAFLLYGVVFAAVALVAAGGLVAWRGKAVRTRAGRPWFLAAAVLAVGAVVGNLTAPLLGGTYHEPVALSASAAVHLQLEATSMPFAAKDQGLAECRSEPDGRVMVGLSALDLGELGPGTMRAGLTLAPAGATTATLALFLDGGDLVEGSARVSWSGTASVAAMVADHGSGQLTFRDLPLLSEAGKPAQDPAASAPTYAWPASLSGQLSWTCQRWAPPRSAGDPPPPSVGP
jgi:hypothetical protein